MSKEQTPIEEIEKAKEFYSNSDTANVYEIMAQFAKQEVLEALEKEVVEVSQNLLLQNLIIVNTPKSKNDDLYLLDESKKRAKEYYEKEVKPRYK